MIEQGLFKRHVVGRDGFQWWVGQVAPEESWKENIPGVPVETNEDESYKGFGERVRVRIMGYATESAETIPDEELPWAHVMYPVTAGGGGRGSWQSMNIVGGNFVFGFFLDGEDAQQPVIMGVIGYNDYQEVMKTIDGPTRYIPHSSFDQEQENNTVPPYSVKQGGAGQTASQEYSTGTPNNDLISESAQGSNSIKEMSAKEMQRKGQVTEPLAKTEDCEPTPTNRIQVEMQNIMREMEHLQNSINDVRSAISIGEADIEGQIAGLQKKLTRFMSANMKSILEQVEKTIIEKVNTTVKPMHNVLMPNERPELKEKMEEANELIACLFAKMFEQLFGMLEDMLSDLFGNNSGGDGSGGSGDRNNTGAKKAINIPICFVNDIAGTALGAVMNEMNQEIDGVMASLDDLLQSTAEAAEAAGGSGSLGSMGSMGGFDLSKLLEDAFSFFKCEEEAKCPTQDTWSMWYGMETGQSSSSKSQKAINKSSKKYSSKHPEVNSGFDGIIFSDLYEDSACGDQVDYLGPRECGPPTAKITGGFGSEANLIITQNGKVIAADVTKLGVNYNKHEANIQVYDDCGYGTGAIVEPITDKVEVCDRGDGFLVITYGDRQTLMPGGQMEGGNLGYIDDPEEPMIPVLDEDGDPFPSCGESVSIVDAIVLAPGTDYLPAPDGSLGGDGRPWADPDDTIIIVPTPGGGVGWLPPVPPGVEVPVGPGDTVITPPTSPIVIPEPLPVEPLPVPEPPVVDPGPIEPDPGPDRPLFPDVEDPEVIGGGEPPEPQPIPPGVPTPIENPGIITTPETSSSRPTYQYPVASDESYPVILYLCDIIVQDPGFNYTSKDELVIEPNNGASATAKLDDIGRVVSVTVDNGGGSFTEIPRIYIKSQTGYNVRLTPKFCIDRLEGEVKDPSINEKLVTVIDCTTRPPNGYLDGKPYYGPFHEHNGVKMVGSEHTSISHATLTDRP